MPTGHSKSEMNTSDTNSTSDTTSSYLADLLRTPEWHEAAACVGVGADHPEVFFPTRGGTTSQALKYCDSCMVRVECRTYSNGLSFGQLQARKSQFQSFGVWDGEGFKARRKRLHGNITYEMKMELLKQEKANAKRDPEYQTECVNGHIYTEKTTAFFRREDGILRRRCLVCRRAASRKHRKQKETKANVERKALEARVKELEAELGQH